MNGINSLMRPEQLPVEQMSNENAVGANTGYPQAALPQTGYSPGSAMPASMNVLQGSQDTKVDPYTGEERLAEGGIAGFAAGGVNDPFAASQRAYSYLMGGAQGQQGGYSGPAGYTYGDTTTSSTSGWSVPEGWIEVDSVPVDGSEWKYVYEPGSNVRHIISKPKAQAETPTSAKEKEAQKTSSGSGLMAARDPYTGEYNMDNPLYKAAAGIGDFIYGGGLGGALGRALTGQRQQYGMPYNFGDGYGISTEGMGIGSIGASQMTPQQIEAAAPAAPAAPTQPSESYADYSARIDAWRASQEAAQAAENQSQAETNRLAASIPSSSSYSFSDSASTSNGESTGGDRGTRGGFADGGLSSLQYNLGSYSDGGRLLKGPGTGISDDIPATIAGKQPARLANNEFVIPARIVSEIGQGSTDAGAKKLYEMMDRIQAARKKTIGKGKIAVDSKADKEVDKL